VPDQHRREHAGDDIPRFERMSFLPKATSAERLAARAISGLQVIAELAICICFCGFAWPSINVPA
jgi:hypothetical protein